MLCRSPAHCSVQHVTKFDEWMKNAGRGGLSRMRELTGICFETLRRVSEREPVTWETAYRLVSVLGGDAADYVKPRKRRKKARR